MNNSSRITVIAEGALCAALSVVLNYLTLFRMPQGGSLNLELVPIFIFSYRHGWKQGVEVGSLYGFLHLFLSGYVVHPAQAFLDYPLAYGVLGFSGLWRKYLSAGPMSAREKQLSLCFSGLWRKYILLIMGTILAGCACFCCYVTSGIVFFAEYTPEGTNAFIYSIVYNASFFSPQLAVNTIVALLLFDRIEKIYPSA